MIHEGETNWEGGAEKYREPLMLAILSADSLCPWKMRVRDLEEWESVRVKVNACGKFNDRYRLDIR